MAMTIILATLLAAGQAQESPAPFLPPLEEHIARPDGDIAGRMVVFTLAPRADDIPVEAQPGHRHPGHVFVYVLEGDVRSMLDEGPAVDYGQGEVWKERPGQLHRIVNMSETGPARLLVVFLDPTETEPEPAE